MLAPRKSSLVARLALLARHGRNRAARAFRERFGDIVLLLLGVAIALVIRSRHDVVAGVEDAGWAAAAVALYLPLAFLVGAGHAFRGLRGWRTSHVDIVQGVMLQLADPNPQRGAGLGVFARCVVDCSDGSQHETLAMRDVSAGGAFTCLYNATFRTTGIHPPHGRHAARWYIKERPQDGWIEVAADSFTYEPASTSSFA